MSHTHRELELLEALKRLGGSARNADLAHALDVSEETVRRTVKALSITSDVERVRGGAYLAGTQSEPSFFRRISLRSDEKRLIASVVADVVEDGMTIYLDVGSTTAYVAEELRQHKNLTVVTNSIGVAQTLVHINNNKVHLLGGEMQGNERGTFGHVTTRQVQRFVIDMAVLSLDGVSQSRGFLYQNSVEADLSCAIAELADQVLIAFDHGKLGENAPYVGPDPRRVSYVVTDRAPEEPFATSFANWGIESLVASENA
ncbi:Glycerol-3-phosphate regulon repressor [Pseudovibrio axinellae]|uniref:Glycerol-3-phosphate regulon repressor n=1 Tax=Pseudovibrio axinellae TaxID=989403 RepID=A0A165SXB0_9HYPH|nr:DeoR/GlpR family DNA-binding transcription regulator [Pseudovibrio axinellae]KZL04608.1 Glycerol-3-phosphate regulon repressor [Pseudovibrio axinellae]SEQ71507.1 transcriptional regulator, DeoR family [Pseudovibrio axinellae]